MHVQTIVSNDTVVKSHIESVAQQTVRAEMADVLREREDSLVDKIAARILSVPPPSSSSTPHHTP
jgi:hypothetical protein